ncbi:FAD-dependent oxidoreductase [Rhodoferax aquaticus]|nr:FAD-dependent oxidoreductase [Rhodoferax aquaticus]
MRHIELGRRTAMGAVGLGLGAVLAPQAFAQTQRPTDLTEPMAPGVAGGRVIVIGAGVSGLAAAQRLRSAGMDVLVLEARDRIGGRVFTQTHWQGPAIDLGASWIHGAGPANPIAKLARQMGARLTPTSEERAGVYSGDGGELGAAEQRWLESIRAQIRAAIAQGGRARRDRSLKALVYSALDYDRRAAVEQRMIDYVLNSSY